MVQEALKFVQWNQKDCSIRVLFRMLPSSDKLKMIKIAIHSFKNSYVRSSFGHLLLIYVRAYAGRKD